jgi:hypothetical protein
VSLWKCSERALQLEFQAVLEKVERVILGADQVSPVVQDASPDIRQSAFALVGDLAKVQHSSPTTQLLEGGMLAPRAAIWPLTGATLALPPAACRDHAGYCAHCVIMLDTARIAHLGSTLLLEPLAQRGHAARSCAPAQAS